MIMLLDLTFIMSALSAAHFSTSRSIIVGGAAAPVDRGGGGRVHVNTAGNIGRSQGIDL